VAADPVVGGFGIVQQTFLQHFSGSSGFLEFVDVLSCPLVLVTGDDWSDAQQVPRKCLGQLGYWQLRQRFLDVETHTQRLLFRSGRPPFSTTSAPSVCVYSSRDTNNFALGCDLTGTQGWNGRADDGRTPERLRNYVPSPHIRYIYYILRTYMCVVSIGAS